VDQAWYLSGMMAVSGSTVDTAYRLITQDAKKIKGISAPMDVQMEDSLEVRRGLLTKPFSKENREEGKFVLYFVRSGEYFKVRSDVDLYLDDVGTLLPKFWTTVAGGTPNAILDLAKLSTHYNFYLLEAYASEREVLTMFHRSWEFKNFAFKEPAHFSDLIAKYAQVAANPNINSTISMVLTSPSLVLHVPTSANVAISGTFRGTSLSDSSMSASSTTRSSQEVPPDVDSCATTTTTTTIVPDGNSGSQHSSSQPVSSSSSASKSQGKRRREECPDCQQLSHLNHDLNQKCVVYQLQMTRNLKAATARKLWNRMSVEERANQSTMMEEE